MYESPEIMLRVAKSHQEDLRQHAESLRLQRHANPELNRSLFARLGRFLTAFSARQEVNRALDKITLYERIAEEGALAEAEMQARRVASGSR